MSMHIQFDGMPAADRSKILGENVLKVFNW